MATPSSSTTSPSPPIPYRSNPAIPQQPQAGPSSAPVEHEHRKKAVQKFLARAEISMVTRALRARLAYASYKATHNIPHVSLRDLEAQSQQQAQGQSQSQSFTRTIAAKRKAVGGAPTSDYYSNPATTTTPRPASGNSAGPSSLRKGGGGGGSGNMAPPASIASPRIQTPSITGMGMDGGASGIKNAPQGPSLYASILAPPPTKQARTIHNPSDPPVPAPSRPTPSPRTRPAKVSPKNEPSKGGKAKSAAAAAKAAKATASPRRSKGGSVDKGKRRQRHTDDTDMDVDGDVDMKAAATLTSLLMHNRPSIAGSTSSPRSSIDGGSEYSYAHFAQSSARTSGPVGSTGPGSGATMAATSSTSHLSAEPQMRTQTPPPLVGGGAGNGNVGGSRPQQTTPRPAPTDSEAANLMLFLATSPSPARPANKESKDLAAYRALGGAPGPLRAKGRVLFPSAAAGEAMHSSREESMITGHTHRSTRSEGSFASVSSSGLGPGAELGSPRSGNVGSGSGGAGGRIATQTGGLLPPALMPLFPSAPSSPAKNVAKDSANSNQPPPPPLTNPNMNTSNKSMEFNFHEYINASPSSSSPRLAPTPVAGHNHAYAHGHGHSHSYGGTGTGGHKANLGLRADVGRKLFEEEQMRQAQSAHGLHPHSHALQAAAAAVASAGHSPGRKEETRRALGAGIDLVGS